MTASKLARSGPTSDKIVVLGDLICFWCKAILISQCASRLFRLDCVWLIWNNFVQIGIIVQIGRILFKLEEFCSNWKNLNRNYDNLGNLIAILNRGPSLKAIFNLVTVKICHFQNLESRKPSRWKLSIKVQLSSTFVTEKKRLKNSTSIRI